MSFVGLYTGLTGIRAAQVGIDVTGHNVANAATPGHTRQRVELVARPSYQMANAHIGTGVDISTIGRLRDGFLDSRYRAAVADFSASTVRADLLGRMEELAGEPDQGISTRMSRLWEAAESWANNPADPATRRQVISELASVSDTIRSTSGSWTALEEDVTSRRDTQLDMANKSLESLSVIDTRIAAADPGRMDAGLLDQRDLLLDEVAQLTGADVRIDENGRALATLPGPGGEPVDLLRDGVRVKLMVDSVGGGVHAAPVDATDATAGPSLAIGGEVGGLHGVLATDLPHWRGELDEFATSFANAINEANARGALSDGAGGSQAGGELLAFDPDNVAATIAVATGVTGADLAAADHPPLDVGGDPDWALPVAPHDGRNARALADLRTTKTAGDGSLAPADGSSLENRLADLVVGLAGEVRAAKADATGARAVSSAAELARVQEHGVSLDEEMVGLVRYQRSLEAASRVMTTVDEALSVLVRTGLVGR